LATKKLKKTLNITNLKKKSPFGEIGNEAISEVSIARSQKNSNNHHMSIFWLSVCSHKVDQKFVLFYSQIWLKLSMDDRHFWDIFLW
jgi:hypothetical protein